MGLFDKILKKRPEAVQQITPAPEIKKEPEPIATVAQVKKRTSWIDELADPDSPVHEKLKKLPETPKEKAEPAQKADPVYCIENNRGDYFVIYKNNKEFFDGDKIAGCGEYILAEGWRGDGEAFALFTNKNLSLSANAKMG